jgi:D-tagatose-1,6-bisphosphate aldolase subunit GatZ/KbaZ
MNTNTLQNIVTLQKQGHSVGIYSACSANQYVIKAVLKRGKETDSCVLIESTANQCDQFGGYTGMTPQDFKNFVYQLALEIDFDTNRLFLGGDHLGPLTWAHLSEEESITNAKVLIQHYILAGFTKIHIDTSIHVADDDPTTRLSDSVIAKRGALLVQVAEHCYQELLRSVPNAPAPVYVVGSEVPTPGGSTSDSDTLQITTKEDLQNTITTFKEAFEALTLQSAWKRVIAVVVQPGVEERDSGCIEYQHKEAKPLIEAIKQYSNLVYEGHSTDYQTKYKLREMVEDGIAILKVGPGLTFAMREALFALAQIEKILFTEKDFIPSHFIEVLEKEMLKQPKYWEKHYHGNDLQLHTKRLFSFSDRCRYYMPTPPVEEAKQRLLDNLNTTGIPLNLLSQYMPMQYTKVREGTLKNIPEDLIIDRIINTIDEYLYATKQQLL